MVFCCGSLSWLRQYDDSEWSKAPLPQVTWLHHRKWRLLIFKSKMPTKCAKWAVILAVTSGKDWSNKTNNLLFGDLWRRATCPPETLPSLDNDIWRTAREALVSRRLHGQARSPGPKALFGPIELPSISFPSAAICLPLPSHLPPTHQLLTNSTQLSIASKLYQEACHCTWYQAGPCGIPGHKSLSVSPHFLITGNRFLLAFMTGLPLWLSGKESACQCGKHKFDPWVEKMPWRRKWQPNPVFLPGKPHGQRSMVATVHRVTK